MPTYEQLIRRREGVRHKVYRDSLGKPTVGIEHLVLAADNLAVGNEITDQQVSAFFKIDGAKAMSAAKTQCAKAGIADPVFVIYLASVNYQLGTHWWRKFKITWKLILDAQYAEAADSLQGTRWQKQTPVRVKDFQRALTKLAGKEST